MKAGKAADIYGLCVEMFKNACYVVQGQGGKPVRQNLFVPCITVLFNAMLMSGKFPEQLSLGYVVPIFKKGDRCLTSNYRGITIISLLSKWYSMALNTRLDKYAEMAGLRSVCQAGFRKKKMVSDWIFVLNTILSIQKAKRKPLFTAFVDFQKAFDSVDRPTLWAVLRNLGIQGQFLEALVSMYGHVRNTVKVNGVFSDIFECLVGVRQGDPLLYKCTIGCNCIALVR